MRSLAPTSTTTKHSRSKSPSRSNLSSSSETSKTTSFSKHSTTTTALRVKPRITPSTRKPTTTTTTTTTTTSSTPRHRLLQPTISSSLRAPLEPREHNALNPNQRLSSSPIPGKTRQNGKMPPPHHEKGGPPRQPALAVKSMGRSPLTPKIASSTSRQPQPVVTPLARRKTETANSSATGIGNDGASPVVALLGNNITPRSGTRQSRVDSSNSTPTGTPNPERSGGWDGRPGFFDGENQPRKHAVTFSPSPPDDGRQDTPESKFFYASHAKGSQASKPQVPPQQPQQRGPMFRHADGSAVGRGSNSNSNSNNSRPTSPGVSTGGFTPALAPTQESHQATKFFHANGAAPDLQPAFRPTSSASGAGSTVSATPKLAGSRTTPGGSRPVSPIKQMQPQGPQQPSAPGLKAQNNISSPPQLGPPPAPKRRVSLEAGSPQPSPHSRSGSVTSGDAMVMSKFMASQTSLGSSEASSPAPLQLQTQQQSQNPAMTMASIIQAAEDLAASDAHNNNNNNNHSEESKGQSEVQSPTKSHAGDPLNDLVANARRERKVQDLEITNASLEAINRSLERQLRKQTNELRRYRRLSRSGRLSLASVASSRVPSDSTIGTATTLDVAGGGNVGGAGVGALALSDLDEEDDMDGEDGYGDDEDDDSLYDTDPSETASASDPLGAASADRRRKRDEKRLQLDLSKHRELLVDSQKINQSIKRCLNWSEDLIKDGKKALEYQVRVSDVDVAPRVLAPQYEDDDDDGGEGQDGRQDNDDVEGDSKIDPASQPASEIGADDALNAGADAGAPLDDPVKKGRVRATTADAPNQRNNGLGIDGASLPMISIPDESAPAASTATATDAPMIKGANLAPPWGKDPQDRDSGIELPVDGG